MRQGTIKHPTRGTTPHYRSSSDVIENQIKAARLSNPEYQFGKQDLDSNAFGDEIDVVMNAGDVLYFPAGMWHKVETLEEGVSINISLMGTTYASLLCRTLEHLLLEKEEWREVICSHHDTAHDVVENLKTLINDLPTILEKSRNSGLAESILPPVLRHPPAFEFVNQETETEQISEDEKFGNDVLSEVEKEESDLEGDTSGREDDQDHCLLNDEDEDERIVDIEGFEMPKGFTSLVSPSHKHWKRNPLASLMRMSDVKSFFRNDSPCYDEMKNNNLYILNVNFAGNEMHESAIRVVLRDGSGQLEHLCSLRGKSLDDAIEKLGTLEVVARPVLSVLIYYGYLVPIER